MPYADTIKRREAARERMQRWRERHPDAAAAAARRWRERNPGVGATRIRAVREADPVYVAREREYDRQRYWANREDALTRDREYRRLNPEKRRAQRAAWWAANPGARNAAKMAYHARKLQAVPAWADLEAIKRVYALAKQVTLETGTEHHVDHVVPLQSDVVCGLHVAENLQILPADENRRKQNHLLEH